MGILPERVRYESLKDRLLRAIPVTHLPDDPSVSGNVVLEFPP